MEYYIAVWKYKGREEEGTIPSNWIKNGKVYYSQSINILSKGKETKRKLARTSSSQSKMQMYLIQFLFIVDQYTTRRIKQCFFVFQKCCFTCQYSFVSWGQKDCFHIHFIRN